MLKILKYFWIVFLPIVVYMFALECIDSSHSFSYPIINVICVLLYLILIRLKVPKFYRILNYIFFPILILVVCILIVDFKRGVVYFTILPLTGFIVEYVKRSFVLICLLLISIMTGSLFIQENWFSYEQNQFDLAYLREKQMPSLQFKSVENDDLLVFDDDKTYIVNFWISSCGVCYRAMKDLQKQKLSNECTIIINVNLLLKDETPQQNLELLERYSIKSFSYYSIDDNWNKYLDSFPKEMIVRDGKVQFIGSLKSEWNNIFYNFSNYTEECSRQKKSDSNK